MTEELPFINISEFDYELPSGRIAFYPLTVRHSSKLLIYKNGEISEDIFFNIDKILPENSLLVFNDTKVIKARIHFENSKGQKIEIFCLEPAGEPQDIESSFSKKGSIEWICLVGNLRKWKEKFLEKRIDGIILRAEITGRHDEDYKIRFWWEQELTFGEVLLKGGEVPLPPYIKREAERIDETAYQTVYAKHEGSVAVPTAGLHFTDEVLNKLESKKIKKDFITLHVGAGTFLPVKKDNIYAHKMHPEMIRVKRRIISDITDYKGNIAAVGTTSLRTLESLYWIGVKILKNTFNNKLHQWEAYKLMESTEYTVKESMEAILSYLEKENLNELHAETELMITPGYKSRITDILITNFHQPKSTLLLLVAAFAGSKWKDIYDYALKNDFRFLSYGDSSVIFR